MMTLAMSIPMWASEHTVTIHRNEGLYQDGTGVYYCVKDGIMMTFTDGLDNENYLVGAELFGDLAGEMINILTVVINGKMTMEMLMGTIWAFPTQTDGLVEMLAPMLHSDMPKA